MTYDARRRYAHSTTAERFRMVFRYGFRGGARPAKKIIADVIIESMWFLAILYFLPIVAALFR